MTPIPVILLRESTRSCSSNTPDPYAYLLSQPSSNSSQPSYTPFFLPVFETVFSNESALDQIVEQGGDKWRGVIVTSQRSVDAWESSANRVIKLSAEKSGNVKGKMNSVEDESATQSNWLSTPFFTVGPSTARALADLGRTIPSCLRPSATNIVGGDSAGNSPALAQIIAEYVALPSPNLSSSSSTSSSQRSPPLLISEDLSLPIQDNRPLLYLTGDKNSTVLATHLSMQTPPVDVQPLDVYQTIPSPTYPARCSNLLAQLFRSDMQVSLSQKPWIVMFSPSTIPLIVQELEAKGLTSQFRYAAIGPTTKDAMKKEPALKSVWEDIVASTKPTAGDLISVLRRKDGLN
ncbi:Uroporphyrinogen III synthase UROS/HEM4 [Phaffia rhodozyma]|uniref:Uroporphyrinogen III synthase UROS/HEM4 n=1 Tax=Phaffia rhodozyma TaxID=264483 RepID=A0A0F7SRB0_PHARH|nr:Uroporphyrinogen III synthase UROS/HEM4 [Phaffia rhodozyma]